MRLLYIAVASAMLIVVSGCAGGGANAPTAQSTVAKQQVTIKIDVPTGSSGSGLVRHAQYVSQATTQMVVNVQTGCPGSCASVSGFPVTASLTPTSGGCTTTPSSTSCQITLSLTPGNYSATLTAEDANGAALSAAQSIPFTIVAGTNNIIPVTLGGIPASIDFVPNLSSKLLRSGNSGYTIGTCVNPQSAEVLTADADGYYIVGPGAPAVSLTASNPSALAVAAIGSSLPNSFSLTCASIVPWNTSLQLTASATPVTGSGGTPQTTNVNVTFSNAVSGTIHEYTGMTSGAIPRGITSGPDRALWFTEFCDGRIGRITTTGTINEYPLPSATSGPNAITPGPDGALWFTEDFGNNIGRITTSGSLTEYPVPTDASNPWGITSGPDGALWFTESSGNNIGRVTTAGSFTEYPLPAPFSQPLGIAAGPDGALWFAEFGNNKIGRITTSGAIAEYPVPTGGGDPYGITSGPDGALWFTEKFGTKIGRITTTGTISEYTVPTGGSEPTNIAVGPDGALWFTEYQTDKVGRITTSGSVTEYSLSSSGNHPYDITAGPDGALWFTECETDKIGHVQ